MQYPGRGRTPQGVGFEFGERGSKILAGVLAGAVLLACGAGVSGAAPAKKPAAKKADAAKPAEAGPPTLEKTSLDGLTFRSIGPAVTGGRVVDIDVNPKDPAVYYVASGHGSLWKTTNGGVTFEPIFDGESAFPIGAVTLDPTNPNVVWVGTGENNAHSYVVPGDGVYKSEDGGKSWTNKGLKDSQQIGDIVVHPGNSDIVWVAAYGPHRASGGDRGVFKTTDGGATWKNVLHPSDYTGCWELHMDPRNPDVLYAVAHQRQRYLTTIVSGGDESGIYKTTDGGTNWKRLEGGLPQKMVGRIGMNISPVDPDRLYAIVDAKDKKAKGFYMSTDAGASWTRQGDYVSTYTFYFQKLWCDPLDVDRVYSMDVFNQVTDDAGKSWSRLGEDKKHVDNHTLWIDPRNPRHFLAGSDGGVYESFDRAETWAFKANMPLAEIYKVSVDNAKPFYNVYIGTQDNNSLGGPSRTLNSSGITNADWFFTQAGDGFQSQVDWADPNIVYAQAQYGALVRYDRKTGERLYLRGFEDEGEAAYRFDWDTPLIVSRHDHKRLYQGAQKLLRSDDRGESWREISADLTRGVPKELHHLMGRSWSADELVSKGSFAHIATIEESPRDEQRLYVGSGDGLLHYTHDGGKNWQLAVLPGLPEFARIHQVVASPTEVDVAYAACSNFFAGDFKPYLYKTADGGAHWTLINANLPTERCCTYTLAVDEVDPNLLFLGTMGGVYVSNTPVLSWVPLKGGMPATAQVLSLTIQRDEHDLVVSTFGRGVYILDDYTPLRKLTPETLAAPAALLPVADAPMFVPGDPLGFRGVGFQGAAFYSAPNPEVGSAITYYVKEDYKSLEKLRNEDEKKLQEAGKDVPYPTYDVLKREATQEEPYLLFVITDAEGRALRKIRQPVKAGLHRFTWDFRTSPVSAISLGGGGERAPWDDVEQGYMVAPGTYQVTMYRYENRTLTALGPAQPLTCVALNVASLPPADKAALRAFNGKVAALSRAISAADAHRGQLSEVLPYLQAALMSVSTLDGTKIGELAAIKARLKEINETLNGDPLLPRYEGQARMSLKGRTDLIMGALWSTTAGPTGTYERAYTEARASFGALLAQLKEVHDRTRALEDWLEKSGAPYTPGRMPAWVDDGGR